MASIISKKISGHAYYYLVESARVEGKPRIVSQQYLGSAEEVVARLAGSGPGEPDRTAHRAFGDLAGVWSVLERLGVRQVVDEISGPRRSDAAASVGTYIALAAANRVVDPCSKAAFSDWWERTAGPRMVKITRQGLDHRRFWDAMDSLSIDDLIAAEAKIVDAAVAEFDLDLSALIVDMTNFATFVDSANERNTIARRGHAKQKRNDLRLVGLALAVTADGQIPVASHAYPGNRPDVTEFGTIVAELAGRWRAMAGSGDELTLTFDAGCDSAPNLAALKESGFHFVGSVPPAQHLSLLAVRRNRYKVVDETRFGSLTYFETTAEVMGIERRVIVTHSPTFHERQRRGFAQTLSKAVSQLSELKERLGRGKTRKERSGVEAEVAAILAPRWIERVITWRLAGRKPANLRLSFDVDENGYKAVEAEYFGKRILFTDRGDWAVADVIGAYRAQAGVEAGFRQLKDPKVVSFSPIFHWTDQKIAVHAFYCVVALITAHLMRREAERAGIKMSVRELLTTLGGIEETVLIYEGETGRPRARRKLTDMNPTQKRLFDLFNLEAYAPKR